MSLCPVCGAKPVDTTRQVLHRCACDHIYQWPLQVTAHYNAKYITHRYDSYTTTEMMSYLRLGFLKAFVQRGLLLDVGYGNGSFVKAATKSGFDAYGNDVHGADYGVREKSLTGHELWDVVTFFDSMEHLPDLMPVRHLAKRAKLILVSFPNRPKDFPANLEWKHYRPGEHLHYFSVCSLSWLLKNHEPQCVSSFEDAIRGTRNEEANITSVIFHKR